MTDKAIIALLAGLLVLVLAGYAMEKIFIRLDGLDRRIKNLENAGADRRHTHKTLNGLFDANSISIETSFRLLEANAIAMARIKQISKILGQVSENPYSYRDTTSTRESDEADARRSLAEQLRRMADDMENDRQS